MAYYLMNPDGQLDGPWFRKDEFYDYVNDIKDEDYFLVIRVKEKQRVNKCDWPAYNWSNAIEHKEWNEYVMSRLK